MRCTFLGDFHVIHDQRPIIGFGGGKVQALLAYLAVESGRSHTRTALAGLLWPDLPDNLSLRNLTQSLVRLRGALGAQAGAMLTITRQTIQWRAGAEVDVDVTMFERLAGSNTAADLEAAAALYGGEFLAGFGLAGCDAFEEWLLLTRERLLQLALRVWERLADQYLVTKRYSPAADAARRQLLLDPWRESAYRQLMHALAEAGDRAAALAAYERCRQTLLTDLGVEPDAATSALAAHMRHQQSGAPAPAANVAAAPPPSSRSTLPAPLTPLVGREDELALITQELRDEARLVTLLGPGGVGKTRLALSAATLLQDAFAAGACWIALVGISTIGDAAAQTDGLAGAILAALGMPAGGQRTPVDELREALRERALLLILDNCEHLPVVGPLVSELLRAASGLRVLTTSRERLGVYGEELLILGGLPVPDEHAAQVVDAPAVQLFVARAQRQVRSFGDDAATLLGVARLCRVLEGMPLGIELAAHWVGEYTPDEMATAIRSDLEFLQTRDRQTPDRHRSLRAVFDYSWRLLSVLEQHALARLSVFTGGFDRAAALAVAETRPATLATLVDKSLLRRVSAGRYSMHELLRQFAAEQLATRDATEPTAQRHAAFYLAFITTREPQLLGETPREVASEIAGEIDNIHQAWDWAVTQARLDLLARSASGVYHFYAMTGQTLERGLLFDAARHAASRSVQQVPDDPGSRSALGLVLGFCATGLTVRGHYDQAIVVAQEALALGGANVEGDALAALAWGWALYRQGQLHEARTRIAQALDLVATHRPTFPQSQILAVVERAGLLRLGSVYSGLNAFTLARETMLQALQICQAQGRRSGEMDSLLYLANLARMVYDLPTARQHYEHALTLVPKMGTRTAEGMILDGLADVAQLEGDYAQAWDVAERALAIYREINEDERAYLLTARLVRLAACVGDQARAADWLARFQQLERAAGAPEVTVAARLALNGYARLIGDTHQALVEAEQCWTIASDLAPSYAQAHSLLILGHARAALHQPDADTAYCQARDLYTALNNPGVAAEARTGLAALALEQGDLAQAQACVEIVLQTMADHLHVGLDEPFSVCLVCYRVLQASDDPRAEAVLHTAYAELIRRADRIPDAVGRQRFLEHVTIHRDLVRAATDGAAPVPSPACSDR